MAQIKGVTLKALQTGIGHDRAGFQANVYFKNKKIGTVLDDGYGGCLDIYIEKEFREQFQTVCNEYKDISNEFSNIEENLMYALYELSSDEKHYKQASKKGYEAIAVFDYKPRDKDGNVDYSKPIPYPSEEIYSIPKINMITDLVSQKKPIKHTIYKSLSDFILS
ncbi:hypothetical protein ACFYKX_27150 [Cytobacillus sp. FJAT-54145]|uniref:Uncharacterized protein n=1 Tax=Cytobacillus spartinae TaxID=3299023 RepID=A0ABW6KN26_9BACI